MRLASEAFEVTAGFLPPVDVEAMRAALLASGMDEGLVEMVFPVPGEPSVSGPVSEYTRQWFVTSEDGHPAKIRMEAAAAAYALELRRSGLNLGAARLDQVLMTEHGELGCNDRITE